MPAGRERSVRLVTTAVGRRLASTYLVFLVLLVLPVLLAGATGKTGVTGGTGETGDFVSRLFSVMWNAPKEQK